MSLKSSLDRKCNVYVTKEPSNTRAGLKLRKSFTEGRLPIEEEASLFVEDRELHLKNEVLPWLDKGFIVITDRYYFSNIAYQGAAGMSIDKLKSINEKFPLPNVILYIELDVDTALQRIKMGRNLSDQMEKKENIIKVKSIYESLKNDYHDIFVTIDGSKSPLEVLKESEKAIIKRYRNFINI